jgi:hypothetical protein
LDKSRNVLYKTGEKTLSFPKIFSFRKKMISQSFSTLHFIIPPLKGLPDAIFSKQKSQIWANFGVSCNRRCWYILWPFGLILHPFGTFLGHVVFLFLFGIYLHVWICYTKKNLAPLAHTTGGRKKSREK